MVDGVAEVGVAGAAVAREVLRGDGHAGRVQPVGEGAGHLGHHGRVGAEAAVADHAAGRAVVEVDHGREHPVDVDRAGQLAHLHPELLGLLGAQPRQRAGRVHRLVEGAHRRDAAAFVVDGHEQVLAEASAEAGDELGRLLLVLDVLVAEHHPTDARADQPVDERVRRVGDPGQPHHEHQARPGPPAMPGCTRAIGSASGANVVSVAASGGVGGIEHHEPADSGQQAHRQQRDRPPGPGRPRRSTGQVLRYVRPRITHCPQG